MIERISGRRQSASGDEKTRGRAPDTRPDADAAWRLEPHVCRVCFGRVASRRVETRHYQEGVDPGRIFQCTNCGLEEHGHRPAVLCACGLKIRKARADGRSAETVTDAGIRCHENKRKSPEFPALFVASYGGAQPET